MRDLEKAIKGLSQKQKDKIFNEGQHWMNMEIMYPKNPNIISYSAPNIVLHGLQYFGDEENSANRFFIQ